jgi:XTP/dITP diphosphohydrolase
MKQLVLASRNAKKAAELQALLAPLGYEVLPVTQFSDVEPDESAPTFIENALIKARHAAAVSGLPALADDSGLEVACLGGVPGVYSARYAGLPSNDAANNAKLLAALEGRPAAQRGARFVCALALLKTADDPVPTLAIGTWAGQILTSPCGAQGFGYDPLFWCAEQQCSAAELPAAVKNQISHRGRALQSLLAQLDTGR